MSQAAGTCGGERRGDWKIRGATLFSVAALVWIWGLSWPVNKIGLDYAPPVLFAGLRTFLGGLFLLAAAIPRKGGVRLRELWPVYLTSTLFNIVLFFGLQTVGLTYLPSGLFSVIVYLEPVLVGWLAWLWLGEPLTPRKIAGLVLGFLGVAAVSLGRLPESASPAGMLLALGAAASWAVGTVYIKRVQGRVDLVWLTAIQCLAGGVFLTAFGSAVERWSDIRWTWPFLGSLVFGILFGVSTSWILWFRLVQAGEVSRVAAYTFLVPLIAVASGTAFLHEPFTLRLLAGLVLIAGSIYLVNREEASAKHAPQRGRTGAGPAP